MKRKPFWKDKNFWKNNKAGILSAIAYFLTIGWYGYVLRIIIESEINLFLTILLLVGGLMLGLFTCISIHEAFSEDDD